MPARRKIRIEDGQAFMICAKCQSEYPMTDAWFYLRTYPSGKVQYTSPCKICESKRSHKKWEQIKNDEQAIERRREYDKSYSKTRKRRIYLRFKRSKYKNGISDDTQ